MMDREERIDIFLDAFDRGYDPMLAALEREAIAADVPIIRRGAQRLLRVLLEQKRPERILEIGTGVGFSAIYMRKALPGACHITTIENYDKRIPVARHNFVRAGVEDDITLMRGDAGELLGQIEDRFPFIFLDGPKGQYLSYLPRLSELLEEGGMLVTDNVLQEGRLLASRFSVERRDRTIHGRMRSYVRAVWERQEFVSTLLGAGDGMLLSVKRSK